MNIAKLPELCARPDHGEQLASGPPIKHHAVFNEHGATMPPMVTREAEETLARRMLNNSEKKEAASALCYRYPQS